MIIGNYEFAEKRYETKPEKIVILNKENIDYRYLRVTYEFNIGIKPEVYTETLEDGSTITYNYKCYTATKTEIVPIYKLKLEDFVNTNLVNEYKSVVEEYEKYTAS